MIEIITALAIALAKAILLFIGSYIFYHRVYDYYICKAHYSRQSICWTVSGFWGCYPIIGNLLTVLNVMFHQYRQGLNNHVMHYILDTWGGGYKPVLYTFFTGGPVIVISDPEIVEAMYTTKNCYFDKHPLIKQLSFCLTGESILFAETTKEWKEARKTISPSLYKGKLEGLTELAKDTVKCSLSHIRSLIKDGEGRFDLIQEINTTMIRVLLVCALGEDVSEEKIDYR